MAYIGNKPAELAVDIDNASVTTEKLANDAVTAAKIVDGTIIADDLNNGIITNSKVASNAAIAATKLAVSGGSNITLQSDGTFDLDASVDVTGGYSVGGNSVINSSRAGSLTSLALTGNATFGDNDKAIFGAGSDLQIYHDGSSGHSIITESGGGALQLQGENLVLEKPDGTNYLLAVSGASGYVKLYQNGSEKLATSSTGISVNGGVTTNAYSYLNGLRISGGDTGNTVYQQSGDLSISSASGAISLKPSGANILHATNTGVGIGASPSTRLTVGAGVSSEEIRVDAGAGWADLTLNSNSTNGGHIYFNDGSNAGEIFYYHPSDYMAFNTAATERMRISSAGDVELIQSNNLYWKHQGGGTIRAGITADSSDNLTFSTGSSDTTRMTIDTNGTIGINATPNANWSSAFDGRIDVGGGGLVVGNEEAIHLGVNWYYDGTNYRYRNTGHASSLYHYQGETVFQRVPSGSAGSTFDWVESARLDTSGRLLVGKSNTTFSDHGIELRGSNGGARFIRSNAEPIIMNRVGSNGEILSAYKDGNIVGSIGVANGDNLYISSNDTNDVGVKFNGDGNRITPCDASGADRNGEIDLGEGGSARFKDLHLSGSIEIENGTGNVGVGKQALNSNSANENTAVGYQAGYSQTSGGYYNTYMGYASGYSNTGGDFNTYYGYQSGYSNQGGTGNTYIGKQAGYLMSGGNYNTILGGYNGNQGGLDIRTSSNRIVLSDGDGNPRIYVDGGGMVRIGQSLSTSKGGYLQVVRSSGGDQTNDNLAYFETSGNDWVQTLNYNNATDVKYFVQFKDRGTTIGSIRGTTTDTTYNTTSDRRLKDNIQPIADATDKLMAMNPVKHGWKADPHTGETVHGFIAQEMQDIVPEAVSGDPDSDEMMSMDYGRITPVLVAALQDAHNKIAALEERLAELGNR